MKRLFFLFLTMIIFTIILFGCNSRNASSKVDISKVNPDIEKWQKYNNNRYGFSIKFPKSWPKGEESTNGDGIILYGGNPKIDIRVYATHFLEGISDPYSNLKKPGFKKRLLKLDNGYDASLITGEEKNNVIYELVLFPKDVEYHFLAKVPKDFFDQNEQILIRVAKSIDISNS